MTRARNRFLLTNRAISDIEIIFDFVEQESGAERALAIEREFFERFNLIASRPGIGHRRSDLTGRRVLFSRVYKWLIVYSRDEGLVTVRRILHGARDVRAILSHRRG